MDWRIKATLQRVLGSVPGGRRLHSSLQRILGGQAELSEEVRDRFEAWRLMMDSVASSSGMPPWGSVLEIGTGWYPLLPLCLNAIGIPSVRTIDVTRLCELQLLVQSVDELTDNDAVLRVFNEYDSGASTRLTRLRDALAVGKSLKEASGGTLDYVAPTRLDQLQLPSGSVDLAFTNNVLAHVPRADLITMHEELHRVIAEGGTLYHSINCNDYYAYFDKSIHPLDYLRYTEKQWARWNTAFVSQNRLRASQFISIIEAAGFTISKAVPNIRDDIDIDQLNLVEPFKSMARDDVLTSSVTLVASKKA